VGNFDWVFLDAYEKSYKPFFQVLEKHPRIPLACHFSGSLIDWLVKNKPEFIQLLAKMAKVGQLEFVGGGYYEPIYGAIPKEDLAGQIQMMRKKIKSLFGQDPHGAWLTERVWDPDLVAPLKKSSVEYTILDDLHLEKAGVMSPVTGYYQAREARQSLDLFASLKLLRYLMPFRKAQETIDFIHQSKTAPQDALVFADDCEKFGLWPGTYQWVYKERWLDQFLTLLEQDKDIGVYTFSQFRKQFGSKGAVRIPHASYSEMMEWSGGHFYNFFKKYPESRYMRDRMWEVSRLFHQAESKDGSSPRLESARQALYRSQCNCTYWHGVFGGLYLHHLRSAVFENLIQAERLLARETQKNLSADRALVQTAKLDSGDRIQIRQKELVSFFNPGYGAALEELDTLPKSVNLMCNLQRHKEAYHDAVLKKVSATTGASEPLSIHQMLGAKEKDLDQYLHYDPFRRLSFMDHFFEKEISLDDFSKSSYSEAGNFIGAPYVLKGKLSKNSAVCVFEKKGRITLGGRSHSLTLTKTVAPAGEASIQVAYDLKNESAQPVDFIFGVEFNFSIGETFAVKGVAERNIKEWIFNDSWRGIVIKLGSDQAATFLAAPVETVSESESGLEKTYQELGVLLQKDFYLKPGDAGRQVFILSVS
jgi:alpha-amylase